jgi:hypothetical protein
MALTYSVANRTDGEITLPDIELIPRFAPDAIDAFITNDLWADIDGGWLIVDYVSTQSSRAQLERDDLNRERGRERQARHRAKKTADQPMVTRDVTHDITRDHSGQDRTGQDRPVHKSGTSLSEPAETKPPGALPKQVLDAMHNGAELRQAHSRRMGNT